MSTNIQERQLRVQLLKEEIIGSVHKRTAEHLPALSLRKKSLLLNDLEYNLGKLHLDSTPEGVGIGAHYNCNAKCIFCLGGKPKLFSLQRYKEFLSPG